jgi:hypothetical protein
VTDGAVPNGDLASSVDEGSSLTLVAVVTDGAVPNGDLASSVDAQPSPSDGELASSAT